MTGAPDDPRSRRAGRYLFLLTLCAYLLLNNGVVQTDDVAHTLSAARGLVTTGSPTVTTPIVPGGGAARGADGMAYAPHGFGMTLLFLPVAALDRVVDPAASAWLVPFLASFLNAFLGAAAVWLFFRAALLLGARVGPAVWGSLLFAFASSWFVYATLSFDAVPAGTALLAAVVALLRWSFGTRAGVGLLVASGTCAGLAVLIRLDSLVVLVPVGLGLLAWSWHREPGVRQALLSAAAWTTPILAALAVTGVYNDVRFGSPLDDGHRLDPFTKLTNPLLDGLAGQLVSPGKSVLLYTPLLLLALVGGRALWRRDRVLTAVVLGMTVLSLGFHAKLMNWPGDLAWGPRFLVPLLGLWLLPVPLLLERWHTWRPSARWAVAAVAAVSVVPQVLGVGVSNFFVTQYTWASARTPQQQWEVAATPLLHHARALVGVYPYPPPDRQGGRFDVWPLNRPALPGSPPASVLLAVPLLLVGVAGGAAGLAAFSRGRRQRAPGEPVPELVPTAGR